MATDQDSTFPDGGGPLNPGEQASAISRSMEPDAASSGRGPTKARTTIGRDHVLVMFENTLTDGERNLVQGGHREEVENVRRTYQEVMEKEACELIAGITGRRVSRFMSANQVEIPDAAAEIFLPEPDGGSELVREAEYREDRA